MAIYVYLQDRSNWKIRGVLFGFCGGLFAPIAGSICTIISWFTNPAWHRISFRSAGTVMFALAIPLLVLGAHCLDLLEKERNDSRSRHLTVGKDAGAD